MKFLSPDKWSRTTDNEGRRIEPIDGGWRLLNHAKYRAIRDEEAIKESKRKHINTKRAIERESNVDNVDRGRHNAEADTDADTSLDKEVEENVKSEPPHFQEFLNLWNETGCFPKCLSFTERRKKTLKSRLSEDFFAQNWKSSLDRIKASDFCIGKNDRGWKADIDWFLRPDSVPRIMEGKYDNKNGSTAHNSALDDLEKRFPKEKYGF